MMKGLPILLVTTLSLCLAKPQANHRFPDILAPLRGMFGASRGNHAPPDRNLQHDSTGAETRRPGGPHPLEEGGESFRPYFPQSFQNSPYESPGLGAERRPEFKLEPLRPQLPPHPEGRPLHHFHPETRSSPQFAPDHGRPQPEFTPEGRPPPPQFRAESPPLPRYTREGRSPYQFSPEGRPPPQFGSGSPPEFSPDSRPPPEFIPEGRPLAHFYPENRSPPQFSPEDSPQFHRRPTRQHRPPILQHPHQHPSHGFPEYAPQQQNLNDEKSTGFTDFAFNPADFDRAINFGGSDEQRPFSGERRATTFGSGGSNDRSSFGAERPSFHPARPISFGGAGYGQDTQDYPEQFSRSPPGVGREALNDLQRGSSGNGEKVVYFDDVYRQPPGNLPLNTPRLNQGAGDSNKRPITTPLSHSLSTSKFRASPTILREIGSSQSENRAVKAPVFKPKSQGDGSVHYGKSLPLLMSGSSTSPPAIAKPNEKHEKTADSVPSPSFHQRKAKWNGEEPIAAASGHGAGIENYGGNDRILYHVAGHAGPYSYRFGYDTGSGYNRMFRHEEKDGNGYVKGKYGFHDKSGKLQVINYSAHPTGGFHSERAH